MKPLVSVVIPTRNRPQLVAQAVRSALAQSLSAIEVVVVIDGSDPATCELLSQIQDPRLQIVELPTSVGGSEARNQGVYKAQSDWIAFLDDDDEWLPQKLEQQIELIRQSDATCKVVATRVIARTPKGEFIWPRHLPSSQEPINEYLLVRKSLFKGEALILCSTLMINRDFFLQHPFKRGLLKHQDTEWILRVASLPDIKIEFVDQPLTIWNTEQARTTVSGKSNWLYSFNWIQEHRHLVSRKSYASFILTQVCPEAVQESDWKAFFPLLLEAIRCGQPRPIDFLLYLGMWLVPRNFRRVLRAKLFLTDLGLKFFRKPVVNH